MRCRFCEGNTKVFLDFSHIPISVTSDCRVVNIGVKLFICENCSLIQKNSTEVMQQNYFNEFQSHSISDGNEQVKFINGIPIPRSEVIINHIKNFVDLNGDLLDIGTGNASFLKAFKKEFPKWELYGQDIQSNSQEEIFKIIKQDNLYIKDIKDIKRKFDILSIIGVLGHIPNLKSFLDSLQNIAYPDSKILIQTPDIQKNFFDVVIIDYITYFSKSHLHKLISKYFKNISFFNIIHKEITLGVNFIGENVILDQKQEQQDILLQAEIFKKFVSFLVKTKNSYVIFGTAPVSTYIGAILGDKLLGFIDEDEVRIGKMHLNKLILHPKKIEKGKTILLPFLQKNINDEIKQKFSSLKFLSFEDI